MATSKSPERKVRVLKPQFGPQEKFLATPADICIYGGAAGGGKTYGLLLSALRYKNVKGFGCTIFRKNYKQIFAQGGLWDEAQKMYHGINGAQRKISDGTWSFRDKDGNEVSKVSFAHIERSEELDNWQGAQICEIGFDELTQLFLGVGSRADGGDDLGSHRVFLGSCPCGDTDFLYSAVCPEETIRAFQQVVKRKAPSARPLSPGEAPDRGLK